MVHLGVAVDHLPGDEHRLEVTGVVQHIWLLVGENGNRTLGFSGGSRKTRRSAQRLLRELHDLAVATIEDLAHLVKL